MFRQQPLHERKCLQRLAQVMACRRKETRLGGIGLIGLPLGDTELVGHAPPFGDVGEGDDDAFHAIVLRPIGQHAADEAGSVPRFNLALHRHKCAQYCRGIGHQIAVRGERIQVRKRAADIARDESQTAPWSPG